MSIYAYAPGTIEALTTYAKYYGSSRVDEETSLPVKPLVFRGDVTREIPPVFASPVVDPVAVYCALKRTDFRATELVYFVRPAGGRKQNRLVLLSLGGGDFEYLGEIRGVRQKTGRGMWQEFLRRLQA